MRDAGLHPEIDLDLVWELDHPESGAGEGLTVALGPVAGAVCGVRVAAVSFLTTRCRWSLRSSGSETLWVVRPSCRLPRCSRRCFARSIAAALPNAELVDAGEL